MEMLAANPRFPWLLQASMSSGVPGLGPPLSAGGGGVGRCQLCGSMSPSEHVAFFRNLGMLVLRKTYKIEADMCRSCIHKKYWEFTVLNLLLGWWGMISLIMTPIYFFQNLVAYVRALHKLRGARG